ncbi:MAG: hypothetical protein KF865_12615 [Bdellovibrionaceae bacterium]|nr:hypothetical protein [Pseudobdellovibrionaceae bacterium]
MKRLLMPMVVILGSAFAVAQKAAPVKVPAVLESRGAVSILTARAEKPVPPKAGLVLRENAVLETPTQGELKLRLSDDVVLTLFESSRIRLPGIRWETGEVPAVILEQGSLRWDSTGNAAGTELRSSLFELKPPPGDLIFRLDPKTAEAEVKVLDGEMNFGAMNAEESVALKARQKVTFRGVVEEGEVAYDVLLKGRRIPRGRLGEVVAVSEAELRPWREEEKRLADLKEKEAASRAARLREDQRRGLICKNPPGRFNECAWVCEGNVKGAKTCRLDHPGTRCARQRCNANGEWAEREVLPGDAAARCKAKPLVSACDY